MPAIDPTNLNDRLSKIHAMLIDREGKIKEGYEDVVAEVQKLQDHITLVGELAA